MHQSKVSSNRLYYPSSSLHHSSQQDSTSFHRQFSLRQQFHHINIVELLRECHKFSLYNYREYFLRRVREEFRQNRQMQDSAKISELVQRGQANLAIIRRQVLIGNLYTPEQRSIIENQQRSSTSS
ncbi:unnamed protein product [Adineta ricciae]|uniref:Complex 1 LYR protein domain-containing protein n=1 Tax=Adineta ricciae TaxID=249248 RepID=A0A814JYY7_ADIRI|nr:unnamed protein product [Adineta ricciae]